MSTMNWENYSEDIFGTGIQFYGAGKRLKCTITTKITSVDPVDPECLKRAVDTTMKRYPYLLLRPEKNAFRIRLVHNPESVVVKAGKVSPVLGSDESNYHLVAYTYEGNVIYLHVFHGIIDGYGVSFLVKTLMFYYIREKYGITIDKTGFSTLDDEVEPEEYGDMFPRKKQKNLAKPLAKAPRFVNAFRTSKNTAAKGFDPHIYLVTVDRNSMNAVMDKYNASPSPFVGIILMRSIQNMFPDSKKNICISLPVNLRKAFNAMKCRTHLDSVVRVVFDERLKNMPIGTQCTCLLGRVILQSDPDSIFNEVEIERKAYSFISHAPFLFLKKLISRLIFAINSSDETAMVSYTGQARFGEASGYFSRIEAITDPCADDILVEICQFNDEYSITFMQRFKDDAYAEAFVKEMRDNGVDASLISEEKLVLADVRF
jgi:hypothetical protein